MIEFSMILWDSIDNFFLFFLDYELISYTDVIYDYSHDYYQCHSLHPFILFVYLIIKIDFSNITIIIIYLYWFSYRQSFFLSFFLFSSLFLVLLLFNTHELSLNRTSILSTRNVFCWDLFTRQGVFINNRILYYDNRLVFFLCYGSVIYLSLE